MSVYKQIAAMTPEEKRIKIAEACGWRLAKYIDTFEGGSGRTRWKMPNGEWVGAPGSEAQYSHIPDYLTDLNAMHEAITSLSGDQQCRVSDALDEIVNAGAPPYRGSDCSKAACINATAAQRADAFLAVVLSAERGAQ